MNDSHKLKQPPNERLYSYHKSLLGLLLLSIPFTTIMSVIVGFVFSPLYFDQLTVRYVFIVMAFFVCCMIVGWKILFSE